MKHSKTNDSKKFLDSLIDGKKSLPKDDLHSLKMAKSYIQMLNKVKQDLNNFFVFTGQYDIDDANAKKLIHNLQKCSDLVGDMLDYMNFAVKTHLAIEAIKSSPKLTAEELKAKIAA